MYSILSLQRSIDEELVIPVQAQCVGCPQPAPLTDPTILEIADFAIKEYDRTAEEDDLHIILRLVKAHTQVGMVKEMLHVTHTSDRR